MIACELALLLLVLKSEHGCFHVELASSKVIPEDIERVF